MLDGVQRRRIALPERGMEMAVLDWCGSGPPALLHHANGFCAALWEPVARGLGDRYRVLAVDARGHGDSSGSEAPAHYRWSELALDLAAAGSALLAELGADRFALGLGHSFGGTLTMAVAARHAALYERILMVDPVIHAGMAVAAGDSPPGGRGSEMSARARRRRHVFASRAEARAHFAERDLFAAWQPEVLDLYVTEGLRAREDGQVELKCPGAVEGAIFEGNTGMNLFARAREVAVPARLLWARQGNFQRPVYEQIAASMDRGDVEDVDAGHLMVMERPELVVDAVLRFTDEEDPR